MVKLKARDLIPGWPRGRSTLRLHGWCVDMGFRGHWSSRHFEDYKRTLEYHTAQQEMLEDARCWHYSWLYRRPWHAGSELAEWQVLWNREIFSMAEDGRVVGLFVNPRAAGMEGMQC